MKGILILITLFVTLVSFSQDKVDWQGKWDKKNQSLQLEATILPGWHLYSQHIKNDVGPIPTQFQFELPTPIQLEGEVTEPKAIEEYDPNFEATLTFFKDKVNFQQKLKNALPSTIKVTVTYMVCSDVMCLPPVDKILNIQID